MRERPSERERKMTNVNIQNLSHKVELVNVLINKYCSSVTDENESEKSSIKNVMKLYSLVKKSDAEQIKDLCHILKECRFASRIKDREYLKAAREEVKFFFEVDDNRIEEILKNEPEYDLLKDDDTGESWIVECGDIEYEVSFN